jgi:chromosome segregation ATPase
MRLLLIAGVVVLTALTLFSATRTLPTTDGPQLSAVPAVDAGASEALIEEARTAFDNQAADLNQTIANLQAANLDQTSMLEAIVTQRDRLTTDFDQASQRLTALEAENATLATNNSDLADQVTTLSAEILGQQAASGDVDT